MYKPIDSSRVAYAHTISFLSIIEVSFFRLLATIFWCQTHCAWLPLAISSLFQNLRDRAVIVNPSNVHFTTTTSRATMTAVVASPKIRSLGGV